MLKVFINGSSGKVGTSLSRIVNQKSDLYVNNKDISSADVVIDFSHPDSTTQIIQQCSSNKIPLIIGTTGLKKNILNEIKKASQILQKVVIESPLQKIESYSQNYNSNIFFKREDLQKVRNIVPAGKLAIGSGVTSTNVDAYQDLADILIVGTSFKFDNDVAKKVDINRVEELVRKIK